MPCVFHVSVMDTVMLVSRSQVGVSVMTIPLETSVRNVPLVTMEMLGAVPQRTVSHVLAQDRGLVYS